MTLTPFKCMEIVNYSVRNPNHVNMLNFDFPYALCARRTRARTCTDANFQNAPNDLVRALLCTKSDFEHFKFLTRIYARTLLYKK